MTNIMNIRTNTKNITFISAAALLAPLALGAVTQTDAEEAGVPAGKTEGVPAGTLPQKAKIALSGYAQAQYFFADTGNNSGDAYSGFAVRRAAISAKGEIGENWSAEVGFEIDGGSGGGKLTGAFVDKAVIACTSDFGKLTVGYQKTAFLMEEYSSSKTQLCIEQSIATRWFAKTGSGIAQLSGRHGGIWWDGKIAALKYALAVTNQYKEDFSGADNDGVAFCASLAYALKTDDGIAVELGVNGVFNPGNASTDGNGSFTASSAPHGNVFGVEPYAKINADGFTGILGAIYADGDADAGVKDAAWGVNATAAYRFENEIEPVVRLSYIDVGGNANLGPSMLQNTPAGTSDHDRALGAYLGANFYAHKNIKISAGYECTKFDGGAKSETANAFRMQLQAVF